MTNSQPIPLYPTEEQAATLPARDIDFAMLQFRFEVLGEALPTLARENSLNLAVLEALAKEQEWELLKVSSAAQEERLQEVVNAANLRLSALKAFREIEKFQSMAKLEDAALRAATRSLQQPDLSPGQIANLAQVLKTVRYSAIPQQPNDLPAKAVRASIDVRRAE